MSFVEGFNTFAAMIPMNEIAISEGVAVITMSVWVALTFFKRRQERLLHEERARYEQRVKDSLAFLRAHGIDEPLLPPPPPETFGIPPMPVPAKDKAKSPRAAKVVLDLLVRRKDYEQLLGDIEEDYTERKTQHSLLYAKFLYWLDTVRTIARIWAPKIVKWIFIIEEIRSRSRPH